MGSLFAALALATLPFRWTPGQIEVEVSVNGAAPMRFVVDTGAEYSILDGELAEALRIPAFRRGARQFARGVTLRLGEVELRDQEVMIWQLDNFRRQGRKIAGVVGFDFFARYVVSIDYAARTLTVMDPAAFQPPKSAVAMPLTFAGRIPVVPVTLEFAGRAPLRANVIIDTGAQIAMTLRHPFAERHHLIELAGAQPRTSETLAAGRTPFLQLAAQRITLAKWSFEKQRIEIYARASGAGAYTESDGLLGNEILRRFRVTVDYSRSRLYLQPSP